MGKIVSASTPYRSQLAKPYYLVAGGLLLVGVALILGAIVKPVIAQEPSDGVQIILTEHQTEATPELHVDLHCDQPSCDAVSLKITFNPTAVQVVQLAKGAFWQNSSNPVHILRERIDNETGQIELMYITENQGGVGLTGTGNLLQLGLIPLIEEPPEFQLISAEVVSLTGEIVLQYQDTTMPQNIVTPTIQPTPSPEPVILVVQVALEGGPAEQVTAATLNNPESPIAPILVEDDHATLELSAIAEDQNDGLVVISAPNHTSCWVDVHQIETGSTFTLHAGDVNADGIIDISDVSALGMRINTPQTFGDVNRDNWVDILDLIHIGRNYGVQTGACSQ